MNRVNLIGRLTRDIELKITSNNISMTKLPLAINDGKSGKVSYITVVAWRELADNCVRFLKKGSKVGIDGYLQSNSYNDPQGNKRKIVNVVAERVEFLSPKEARTREAEEDKQDTPTMSEALGLPEIEDLPWN